MNSSAQPYQLCSRGQKFGLALSQAGFQNPIAGVVFLHPVDWWK
jgi:hypothetical protein